jgi:uncharacterized membrane protein
MNSEERMLHLSRIHALSDGVFAFSLTLMVLSFDIPRLAPSEVNEKLAGAIWAQLPNFQSFIISFFVIATFWFSHHQKFQYIKRYNKTFIWLNLIFLMFIAFLPFPTNLVGEYDTSFFAIVFYSLSLALTGVAFIVMWTYATYKNRLTDSDFNSRLMWKGVGTAAIIPAIFILSAAISLIDVRLAKITWLLVFTAPFISKFISPTEASEN